MALKFSVASFPIFVPQKLSPGRPPTEIRFSRWNNANAERFNERRRAQKEIEDDIRRERRFDSAARISQLPDASSPSGVPTFRSAGTPSSPSSPSIPGKKSKYSKPHPAFKKISRVQKTQIDGGEESAPVDRAASVALTEDGVSYIINGAPFEFKYSYTETPKVKPLKLREPPYAPFGPTTMGRPWTGKAPFPPSKKNLPEFDSFKLPPPGKKGVKPVQAPGPYLPGTGPRHVKLREEILGEPLTKAEVMALLKSCMKSSRQMNMGRDGLTHNMLENIHAHWKRRRVCKIKCKGVCTVDMDNVKQQLEERTGGKIIHSHGGVIYLFRGRNYNYRTRPRFPLMLWRPVTPVYPRLIKRAPEGLTLEEATEMRKKGRQLIPICKLAKNGVYCDLAKNVREAFEECELVRINCQGLNGSDYRKIGAKLKDLVPCILISFENEHILMWRGRDWKSFLPTPKHGTEDGEVSPFAQSISGESEDEISIVDSNPAFSEERELEGLVSSDESTFVENDRVECSEADSVPAISNDMVLEDGGQDTSYHYVTAEEEAASEIQVSDENELEDARSIININASNIVHGVTSILEDGSCSEKSDGLAETASSDSEEDETHVNPLEMDDTTAATSKMAKAVSPVTDGVMLLLRQAIENGSALILEEKPLDADIVFRAAVSLAKTAPAGPVFRHGPKRVVVKKADVDAGAVNPTTVNETEIVSSEDNKKRQQRDSKVRRKSDLVVEPYPSAVSHGSLRVDELAKLLA